MTTLLTTIAFALLLALSLALYRHARTLQGHNAALQHSLQSEKRRADTLFACAAMLSHQNDALTRKWAFYAVRRRRWGHLSAFRPRALDGWKIVRPQQ